MENIPNLDGTKEERLLQEDRKLRSTGSNRATKMRFMSNGLRTTFIPTTIKRRRRVYESSEYHYSIQTKRTVQVPKYDVVLVSISRFLNNG